MALGPSDPKPKGVSYRDAYTAIRNWYRGNAHNIQDRADEYARHSAVLIDVLPLASALSDLEFRAIFGEVIYGLLEWGYHQSDGRYKMAAYAHAALEAAGLSFRLTSEDQSALEVSTLWQIIRDKPEVTDEPISETGRPDEEYLALALLGDSIKIVSLSRDGRYTFLDSSLNVHSIFYVVSETLALEQAVKELESLINNPRAREEWLQNFFERNPDFILNDEYKNAHSHVVLADQAGKSLVPDFILEPMDQAGICDLLELKLPATPIFNLKARRIRFSAAVMEACAQLREYSMFFDDEKK